jgi:hypothetical protein
MTGKVLVMCRHFLPRDWPPIQDAGMFSTKYVHARKQSYAFVQEKMQCRNVWESHMPRAILTKSFTRCFRLSRQEQSRSVTLEMTGTWRAGSGTTTGTGQTTSATPRKHSRTSRGKQAGTSCWCAICKALATFGRTRRSTRTTGLSLPARMLSNIVFMYAKCACICLCAIGLHHVDVDAALGLG